jgi:DNA-binding NtrC family response regulator
MDLSILYLDDDSHCLNIFVELFGGNYDVRIAFTLAQARQMLRERSVEVVISDRCLPEIKGREFLKEIAREYPGTYLVMLTGTSVIEEMTGAAGASVIDALMPKPWAAAEMRAMLERAEVIVTKRQLCK